METVPLNSNFVFAPYIPLYKTHYTVLETLAEFLKLGWWRLWLWWLIPIMLFWWAECRFKKRRIRVGNCFWDKKIVVQYGAAGSLEMDKHFGKLRI